MAAVAAPRPPSVVVSVTDTPAGPAVRHAAAVDAYHAIVRRRLGLLAALSLAVVCALVLDVATGPSNLPLRDTLQLLLQRGAADSASAVIVWEVRLPQALMALCVGAALALAGTEMQTSLNNPLASPFTLGMSSAAILGAALAIVLEISLPGVPTHWVIPANAFAFALVAVFLLQAAAARQRGGAETLVLLGIALYFTFNALVAITQFLASEQALQQLVFWTMGSLGRASWTEVRLLAVVLLLVAPWSWRASWRLTALRGDVGGRRKRHSDRRQPAREEPREDEHVAGHGQPRVEHRDDDAAAAVVDVPRALHVEQPQVPLTGVARVGGRQRHRLEVIRFGVLHLGPGREGLRRGARVVVDRNVDHAEVDAWRRLAQAGGRQRLGDGSCLRRGRQAVAELHQHPPGQVCRVGARRHAQRLAQVGPNHPRGPGGLRRDHEPGTGHRQGDDGQQHSVHDPSRAEKGGAPEMRPRLVRCSSAGTACDSSA